MKPWLQTFLKEAATGPASLAGISPGSGSSIAPALNPVQQIQQQRMAAGAQSGTPAGNPEVMAAEQAAAAAEQKAQQTQAQAQQEAQAQVQQVQQQMAQQQMKMQQEAAQKQQQANAELQAAKAEIDKSKAEAELAKIEASKAQALSEIDAATTKHKAEVGAKEVELQAASQKAQSDAEKMQAAQGTSMDAAVLKHRVEALGQRPAKKANTMQMMQYGMPKGPDGHYGKILQTATYRPSFGGIGDKIVDVALPMVYGQPKWGDFFAHTGPPQGMQTMPGFDPISLMRTYGADIARNFQ